MLLGVVILVAGQNIESHAAKTLGQFLGIACQSQHSPVQEFVVMHPAPSARVRKAPERMQVQRSLQGPVEAL